MLPINEQLFGFFGDADITLQNSHISITNGHRIDEVVTNEVQLNNVGNVRKTTIRQNMIDHTPEVIDMRKNRSEGSDSESDDERSAQQPERTPQEQKSDQLFKLLDYSVKKDMNARKAQLAAERGALPAGPQPHGQLHGQLQAGSDIQTMSHMSNMNPHMHMPPNMMMGHPSAFNNFMPPPPMMHMSAFHNPGTSSYTQNPDGYTASWTTTTGSSISSSHLMNTKSQFAVQNIPTLSGNVVETMRQESTTNTRSGNVSKVRYDSKTTRTYEFR